MVLATVVPTHHRRSRENDPSVAVLIVLSIPETGEALGNRRQRESGGVNASKPSDDMHKCGDPMGKVYYCRVRAVALLTLMTSF